MKRRKNILKGIGVLLIVATMILSTVVVTANKNDDVQPVLVSPKSPTLCKQVNPQAQPVWVIWDNNMNYDNNALAMDAIGSYDAYPADDFVLVDPYYLEVNDVHWITKCPEEGSNWCISFMKEDEFKAAPDSHPKYPSYAGPYHFAWDEIQKTPVDEFCGTEMSVMLPENIKFNRDEYYWISIWSEYGSYPSANWAMHNSPIMEHIAVIMGLYYGLLDWTDIDKVEEFGFKSYDMCFQLTYTENLPPTDPQIRGPPIGRVGEEYEYWFTSLDPEEQPIQYIINWGDGEIDETDYHESGEEVSLSHIWSEKGTYIIEAKAIDILGAESEWSEYEVTMPRNRIATNNLLMRFFEQFPLLLQTLLLRFGLQ